MQLSYFEMDLCGSCFCDFFGGFGAVLSLGLFIPTTEAWLPWVLSPMCHELCVFSSALWEQALFTALCEHQALFSNLSRWFSPPLCSFLKRIYCSLLCWIPKKGPVDRPLSVQFSPFLVPCLTSSSSLLVSRLSIHRVHQALSGFLLLMLQTINSLKVICGNYRAHLIISHLRDPCSSLPNIQWLENLCFIYFVCWLLLLSFQ